MKYKAGDVVVRTFGKKGDIATIVGPNGARCYDKSQAYIVIEKDGHTSSWNEHYFRKLTKLEKALA